MNALSEYATIPANGHSWSEWSVERPATILLEGLEARTCSVCRERETRSITKLPHDHVYDGLNYVIEPTCTKPGTAKKKCSLCGDLGDEIIEVPALGHSWNDGEVTTPATCEAPGTRTFTCTRCGETETREIAALGHDYTYVDDPAATCTEAGTRIYTCRNDDRHTYSESIKALGHEFGPWETYIEATETTDGENRRYCIRGCGEYESEVVPKTGEAFGETGLPVSKYEWPSTIPEGKTQNDTTTISPTEGIIKCVKNGVTSYYVIFGTRTVNYNQLLQGPDDAIFNDVLIKLTGVIKTSSNVNNGQLSVQKGDLYQTADGEYYACKSVGGMVNVDRNNPDNSVKNDTQNWYHIQKPDENQSSNGTNVNTTGLSSTGKRAMSSSKKVMMMSTANVRRDGASVASEDSRPGAKGAARGADENAERKARIAALMNTTADQIVFRSEFDEQSNVDVWEYVNQHTGSGTDWHWTLENLDAYDDDGNKYTYYVVETSPDESLYEITYDDNGLQDSDENDTITIKNKQKVGSVKVTKMFAGLPDANLPAGFKITATYTEKGEQKTVELTASTEGVTGDGTTEPYTWTINSLPIGTVVTFTESCYDVPGYTVVTNPAADEHNVVSATATAAETPGTASFVNTYTQDVKVTLDILKIEKDNPSKKLPNAAFTLREINSEITASKPTYKNPDDPGITTTTDSKGEASFEDLETGYYEIRESGVPAGYVVTEDVAAYIRVANGSVEMIKVNAAGDGWETVSTMGNFEFAAASGTDNAKVTVSNEPGAALPNSGGPGTTWIYLFGSLLLLGCGTTLVARRRMVWRDHL